MRYPSVLLVGLLLATSSATAAQTRLDILVERLSRTADYLASQGYGGFVDGFRGDRRDIEALFLAHQFRAGAALFRQLVRDRRPPLELRDGLTILMEQVRASSNYGFGQRSWQDIHQTLDEIGRELNMDVGRGREYDDSLPSDRVTGRMRWRGRIDDHVQIYVQRSSATAKEMSGSPVSNATVNFTAPLPQRRVNLDLRKIKGRGSMQIIQQPSRDNEYTAVIELYDPRGGSEEYEFELLWSN